MTPAARLQAAIELSDEIQQTARGADRVMGYYFAKRRFMGSGDRAAVRNRAYGLLRRRARLDWWLRRSGVEPSNRSRVLADLALEGVAAGDIASLFAAGGHGPAALDDREQALAASLAGKTLDDLAQPDWVRAEVPEWTWPALESQGVDGLRALNRPAPLDLRVNALKATREEAQEALAADGVATLPTPHAPLGLRAEVPVRLDSNAAYKRGVVEVQDEGSQIAAAAVDARPGGTVIDWCAGAGGKTLALAAAMANRGRLIACDESEGRMAAMEERLVRAGVTIVERMVLSESEARPSPARFARHPLPQGEGISNKSPSLDGRGKGEGVIRASLPLADCVLVDAPCSGSGTWRRHPEAKWRLTPAALDRGVALQRSILSAAAKRVRPGGRLTYAVCSLFACEGEAQMDWFLAAHPEFLAVPAADALAGAGIALPAPPGRALRLSPHRDGTDGFFIATLRRA